MSYRLNKTNGDLLVELVDGQIDTTSTDITLVGRNYKGFGEFINENYIKMLENFAKTNAPGQPLTGQLWYDTAEERLKIYTGETFKPAGGPVISASRPNLVAGDLWIDSENNKLYFFDGSDVVMVGPQYDAGQGVTGLEPVTVVDNNDKEQIVLFMYMGGVLTGIWSRNQFRPSETISGYPLDPDDTQIPRRQLIKPGFNPVNADFWYRGTVQSTSSLIDVNSLEEFTPADFLKTKTSSVTTGGLKVRNPAGLTIGRDGADFAAFRVVNNTTFIETQKSNEDFGIRTTQGQNFDYPFYVDASTKRVGIYTQLPTVDFDVNGNSRITGSLEVKGNLTVQGDTTFINTSTLRVEDKNIELGLLGDSTIGDDTYVDGAGIIVVSSQGSKDIVWSNSTKNWNSNQSFNLVKGKDFKINNVTVLSADRLHDGIQFAEGLNRIGQLEYLDVDTFNFNGNTLTTSGVLNIEAGGLITINSRKIAGVVTPASNDPGNYVANKDYVDTQIDSEPVVLALDVTGRSNPSPDLTQNGPYRDVIDILQFLYPASEKREGTKARIHAVSYTAVTVTGIDVDSAVTKTNVSVLVTPQDSTTPEEEIVISDIRFDPVSGSAVFNPVRANMVFRVDNNAWVWETTTVVA